MKKLLSLFTVLFLILINTTTVFAIDKKPTKTVEVFEDTQFKVVLDKNIDNLKNKTGDEFTFSLQEPYKMGKETILPEGTKFIANITRTAKAGWPSRDGVIKYQVKKMQLPSGEIIPIKAKIAYVTNTKKQYKTVKCLGGGGYAKRMGDNFHDNYKYYRKWAFRKESCFWAIQNQLAHALATSYRPKVPGKYLGERKYVKTHLGGTYEYVWVRGPLNPIVLYAATAKVVRTPGAVILPLFKTGKNFTKTAGAYKKVIVLKKPIMVPIYADNIKTVNQVTPAPKADDIKKEIKGTQEEVIEQKDENETLDI